MPAKSLAQKHLMDAAAHNPAFAKKVGIPSKVAKEYSSASKGMTFRKGGEMKESKAMAKKEISFMQKKGAPKSMIKHEKAEYGMKKGGKVKKYVDGGATTTTVRPNINPGGKTMPSQANVRFGAAGAPPGIARAAEASGRSLSDLAGGRFAPPPAPINAQITKPGPMKKGGSVKKMATGGYTRSADGVAAKGKTKGKIVKMAAGGLPSQASDRATEALKARPALPSQAQGVRPFKKGGRCK